MTRRSPSPAPAAAAAGGKEFLTVGQVAEELGVTRSRVYQLIRAGALRASRLVDGGRYIVLREWLLEAVRGREVRAAGPGGQA